MPEVSTTDRRPPALRAISETCPPGEGMLLIFELFVAALWSPAARWQPGAPGDRPAGRTRRAHVEGCLWGWAGSGADGAALMKRRKSEPLTLRGISRNHYQVSHTQTEILPCSPRWPSTARAAFRTSARTASDTSARCSAIEDIMAASEYVCSRSRSPAPDRRGSHRSVNDQAPSDHDVSGGHSPIFHAEHGRPARDMHDS